MTAPADPPLNAQPIAELRRVGKRYGSVVAATNLDLQIYPAEFLSFLGPSGCGKTTALRMLAGFEDATEGEVLIDGQVVNGLPAYRRPVNMVFQQYALFPHMNVAQNVGYGLRQRRPRPAAEVIDAEVAQALAMVRLSDFATRRIWELSGGQQQRVALARAIVNRPKILLLDEPMAALDKKLRHDMQLELKSLQRELGITFVLVTHDQDEALTMSDRICIMDHGRIVQVGTPEDLYDRPANRYVADFVGRTNFVPARAIGMEGDHLLAEAAGGVRFRARPGQAGGAAQQVTLSLRPEEISLRPATGAGAGEGHRMRVAQRIFLGEHVEYHLQSDALGRLLAILPRHSGVGPSLPDTGDEVEAAWRDGAALALAGD